MNHFHANQDWSGQPDHVFATEQEARAYLATGCTASAVYLMNDEACDGDRSLACESLDMAKAILTSEGRPCVREDGTSDGGQEWEEPLGGAIHWFDPCDDDECQLTPGPDVRRVVSKMDEDHYLHMWMRQVIMQFDLPSGDDPFGVAKRLFEGLLGQLFPYRKGTVWEAADEWMKATRKPQVAAF